MWSLVIGDVAISCAIVVGASLKFARWAIEREDRLAVEQRPLTPEIRQMKRETLIKKRQVHAQCMIDWAQKGYFKDAETHRLAIDKIYDELMLLEESAP